MTSTSVTSMTNLSGDVTTKSSSNSNKSNVLTKSFTQVMGNASNTTAQQYQDTQNTATDKSVKQSESTGKNNTAKENNDVETNQDSDHKVTESGKTKNTNTELSNEMKKELAEKADNLVSEVAKKLNMSEDEIRTEMEMMGIQAVDLLNPDIMSQLIVNLSGETDMMSLVLDENLYGTLKELIESANHILQDLEEQFQVTPEVLLQAMDELKAEIVTNNQENVIPQENVMPQENVEESEQITVVEVDTKVSEEPVVVVEKEVVNQSKVTEQNDAVEQSKNKTNAETFTETEATTEKPLEANVYHGESQSENGQNKHSESGQTFLQGLVEQAVKIAENVVENTAETSFASALGTQDTESIMKQMMNYMKIHLGSNVTEMEMQLQPASLGTVNLQIASQNGAITAHFTVQNQGVKEALESQIVQLKENLEERGVKVDAVEVTIASHEFERNLEQGGKQEAQESEKTEATKKANRRRLVLDDLGETSEELEESDKIQVELMQQSGNSVNFMA